MVYNKLKIDLNSNLAAFSCDGDTTLRLECFRYGGNKASGCEISRANYREQSSKTTPHDGCRLVLGLGPTPRIYPDDYRYAGIKSNKKPDFDLNIGLPYEEDSVLKLGFSNHSSTSKSDLNPFSIYHTASTEANNIFGTPVLDEGSASAKKLGGYLPSLLLAPRMRTTSTCLLQKRKLFDLGEKCHHGCSEVSSEQSVVSDYSTGTASDRQTHSIVSNSIKWLEKPAKRRQLIPPQVLVPSSMKSSSSSSFTRQLSSDRKGSSQSGTITTGGRKTFEISVPDGRIHGGSLL